MTSSATQSKVSAGRIALIVLWCGVLAIGAYFVAVYVPRVWTNKRAHHYYWPRKQYLLPHIAGGLVAIIFGPFQFWSRIRNNHPRVHRFMGRTYLIAVLVGGPAAIGLALTSSISLPYMVGLTTMGTAWLLVSGMAYVAVKKRNFDQHQQWMIRSYVLTFAFVTIRLANTVLAHLGVGTPPVRLGMLAWGCWAVPLLVTELVIQGKQILSSSNS